MDEIDKYVNESFSSSYMNNTKWLKLFDSLFDTLDEFYVEYKLVSNKKINTATFYCSDMPPFFIEPVFYKEVEWICFPAQYVLTVNKRKSRKYKKEFSQDIGLIELLIKSIGEFELEIDNFQIKLFAYRK